jgi:hypothetical protein
LTNRSTTVHALPRQRAKLHGLELSEQELQAVNQSNDPAELDGGDHGKDGDVMHPITSQPARSPNLGLVACLLFCLACWAGLVYLIGLALG